MPCQLRGSVPSPSPTPIETLSRAGRRPAWRRLARGCAWLAAILLAPALARAEWITRNVEVGGLPRAIAVNPVTGKVYLAQEDSAFVFVYRPLDGRITRIPVGLAPSALAVNPVTNRVYCANQGSASVSVIDGATDAVIATPAVGAGPYAVVVNPVTNKAFVTSITANALAVIEGETNVVERTIPVGTNPRSLCVNPLTNKVYVANRNTNNVTVIDANTWTEVTLTVGTWPNAIVVNPTTNRIYVANQGSSNVTLIDGDTNGKTTITAGSNPYVLGVDPVSNQIYCGNVAAGTVTIINGATNGTATVSTGTNPVSIAVNARTRRAYVCNLGASNLTVIDGATNGVQNLAVGTSALCAVVNSWSGRVYVGRNVGTGIGLVEMDATTNVAASVPVGAGAAAVAVNRRTHRAYVANATAGSVTEVDLATGAAAATILVGSNPVAIVADPLRGRIYTANSGGGTVSVIDGATRAVHAITVGAAPRDLELDERLGRLWVANSGDNTVSRITLADESVQAVPVGEVPVALAFDPWSDACWVASRGDNTVQRIAPGLTVEWVGVGASPADIALDPVTRKVFTANSGDHTITTIDAVTLESAPTAVGNTPVALAVDAVRGRVFVADSGGSAVTAVRESDGAVETIAVGARPVALAIDAWAARLYVGTLGSVNTWIVDLGGRAATNVSLAAAARALAVDEVLGVMIAAPASGALAPWLRGAALVAQPLSAAVAPLGCDQALAGGQAFSGTATSTRSPRNAGILGVYVALDDPARGWTEAPLASGGGTFAATWSLGSYLPGTPGNHVLRVAALDATSATLDNSSQHAGTVYAGAPGDYAFVTVPATVPPTQLAGRVQATVIARPYESTPVLRGLGNARVSVVGTGSGSGFTSATTGTFSFAAALSCGDQVRTELENDRLKVIDTAGSNCGTNVFPGLSATAGAGAFVDFVYPVTGQGISGDAANGFYLAEKFSREYWQARLHRTPGPLWIIRVHATTDGSNGAAETGSVGNGFACSSFRSGATSHADVVYHEFGHRMVIGELGNLLGLGSEDATTGHDTYPQAAGMDEGFADYFTASFTNDSRITDENDRGLRNLFQAVPLQYNWCGGEYRSDRYYGALLFGGALWDLRTALVGTGVADSTVDRWIFNTISRYGAPAYADPASRTFLSFRNLLKLQPLQSSHLAAIDAAFARHNIQDAPAVVCTGSPEIQAVDRAIDQVLGQILSVSWKKAPGTTLSRLYARLWTPGTTGIARGILLADSLSDSSYVYVNPDTTVVVSFVLTGLDGEGNEGPQSPEGPAVLSVPPVAVPRGGLRLAVLPNPVRSHLTVRLSSAAAGPGRIRVYDVAGRHVRTLWEGALAPEVPRIAAWDLRNARGGRVPEGVYLVRAEGVGQVVTSRAVVLGR